MKINLLTDADGKVIGLHVPAPLVPVPPNSRAASTVIVPSEGQSIHAVELPVELERKAPTNTLLKELQKWKVDGRGKSKMLVKR